MVSCSCLPVGSIPIQCRDFALTILVRSNSYSCTITSDHHCVLGPVLDTYILMAQEEALPDCLYLLENRKAYWHSEVVRRLCEIDHPLVKQALSVRYLTHSTSAEERELIECYLNANCKDSTEQKVNEYILSRLVLNVSQKPSEDDDTFSGFGSLFG